MTGGAFTESARAFLDSIPNERIEKPFDLERLRARPPRLPDDALRSDRLALAARPERRGHALVPRRNDPSDRARSRRDSISRRSRGGTRAKRCTAFPPSSYAELVLWLRAQRIEYTDEARRYTELAIEARVRQEPFPHQREAIERWLAHRGRGVVVLPTGSGKTLVATLAIAAKKRSALVVVPTIDLLEPVVRRALGGVRDERRDRRRRLPRGRTT